MVAAELEGLGAEVESLTPRPRGHPWDRELRLDAALAARLRDVAGHALVVDEGPGLSGSSFGCVPEALRRAGWPDDRIALFPSWDGDGAGPRAASGREAWARHRRWTAPLQEARDPRAAPWDGAWAVRASRPSRSGGRAGADGAPARRLRAGLAEALGGGDGGMMPSHVRLVILP